MLCTKIVFCFCFDIQNNICTQHVVKLYFSWNSMNNLLSYCGLTNSRIRASDTDLPVQVKSYQMLSFFHQLAQNMTWILSGGFTEIILVEKYLMNINLFTKTKLICKSTFLSLWHHRTGPNVEIQLYLIQDAVVHPRFLSDFQLLKYIGIFVVWLMLVFGGFSVTRFDYNRA